MFPKIVVPPKSSILIGFSIINHPFWCTTIFGNTHKYIPSFFFQMSGIPSFHHHPGIHPSQIFVAGKKKSLPKSKKPRSEVMQLLMLMTFRELEPPDRMTGSGSRFPVPSTEWNGGSMAIQLNEHRNTRFQPVKNTWRFLTKITRKSWWIEIICINNL